MSTHEARPRRPVLSRSGSLLSISDIITSRKKRRQATDTTKAEDPEIQRLRQQQRKESITESQDFLRDFVERWSQHHVKIQCDLTMPELRRLGYLTERDGTKACRRLVSVPVFYDEIGHELWKKLAEMVRGPGFLEEETQDKWRAVHRETAELFSEDLARLHMMPARTSNAKDDEREKLSHALFKSYSPTLHDHDPSFFATEPNYTFCREITDGQDKDSQLVFQVPCYSSREDIHTPLEETLSRPPMLRDVSVESDPMFWMECMNPTDGSNEEARERRRSSLTKGLMKRLSHVVRRASASKST